MNKSISIAIILGVSLMVTTMTDIANAEESIGIFSLQSEVVKTDDIMVTGFVNTDSFYKPVKLHVYDPNGNIVYMPDVQFNDEGQFSWLIHPPLGKFDATGTYTIVASHENISETAQIEFTVVDNANTDNSWLQTVMSDSNSFEEVNSQNKVLEIQQSNTEQNSITRSAPKINNEPMDVQSNVITSDIQDVAAQQESIQTSNEFVETLESPIVMTAIAVTIAGVIAGIVIWMRQTYEKPMVQK